MFADAAVEAAFASYPPPIRSQLLNLRQLIIDTAEGIDGVGPLEEALRWGQPAYLTTESGSGSTIRLAPTKPESPHDYAMYFICTTNLVTTFTHLFGEVFSYEGNRALLFTAGDDLPEPELQECIGMALTYHRR
ncbi:MAG: DUF1801 domain-containing protein [Acidimicrobiia bacterium]|nr:DUF1801 domain-containing protein [Acidimicrobiia bacterium]